MALKHIFPILTMLILFACKQKTKVDSLYFNAKIYTVDSAFTVAEALAIKDGKFVAVGSTKNVLADFDADEKIDLNGNYIYPGLIDAHSHFYGLGRFIQQVDLTACTSFDEVIERCKLFYQTNKPALILGRGWDQNLWTDKNFPSNEKLNEAFPNISVLLKRVDGHAAIVNNFLLNRAQIDQNTKVDGGKIVKDATNKPTGVLIDNAVDLVTKSLPQIALTEKIKALKLAEKICFENGLTSVCDAGLEPEEINLIDSLQKSGDLKIRVYAMISISEKNVDDYLKRGTYKNEKLNVSSFKMYADGSLGSRGACLLKPYSDEKDHYGFLLTDKNKMELYVSRISKSNFQLCTHCIGDSANRLVLNLYAKHLGENNQKRWRIEHAQVVETSDLDMYKKFNIIPSVQPTHATSDMNWADERLENDRIKNAYAYKDLLNQNGWIPLGTDFPVENVSPFYTFYSAVFRMDNQEKPISGFQTNNALTREEALRGMTIWAAQSAFEENEKGSIEVGKFADFIVCDIDLMNENHKLKIRNTKPKQLILAGKKSNN